MFFLYLKKFVANKKNNYNDHLTKSINEYLDSLKTLDKTTY